MLEEGDGLKQNQAAAAARYEALFALEQSAPRVVAEAHLRLANMQIEGRGVPRDLSAARTNCRAAVKCDPQFRAAYVCVGYFSLNAPGAPDYDEAFKAYKRAFELGDGPSTFVLGRLYENGQGVKADKIEAGTLYASAALMHIQGAPEALDRVIAGATPHERKKLLEKLGPMYKLAMDREMKASQPILDRLVAQLSPEERKKFLETVGVKK